MDAPDKLVALVRDEVDDGPLLADAEEVAAELDADELEREEAERAARRLAEDVGVERARLARDDGREEDVGDDGHDCTRERERERVSFAGSFGVLRAREGEREQDAPGMYRSGQLRSSRGGFHPSATPVPSLRTTLRLQGRCRQGQTMRRSLLTT